MQPRQVRNEILDYSTLLRPSETRIYAGERTVVRGTYPPSNTASLADTFLSFGEIRRESWQEAVL